MFKIELKSRGWSGVDFKMETAHVRDNDRMIGAIKEGGIKIASIKKTKQVR